MDHYRPSLSSQCVFSILPPEGQCATLAGGECIYHLATLPRWTKSVVSILPPEGQCATLSSGECLYNPVTLPKWTIKDLV